MLRLDVFIFIMFNSLYPLLIPPFAMCLSGIHVSAIHGAEQPERIAALEIAPQRLGLADRAAEHH